MSFFFFNNLYGGTRRPKGPSHHQKLLYQHLHLGVLENVLAPVTMIGVAGKQCEMDLVMAQQLVQTWVMALVYWKLLWRGGSHGPTDVSSTNASPMSVPLLPFTCHFALLENWVRLTVFGRRWDPAVTHWTAENTVHVRGHLLWLVSRGACQPLFTWRVCFPLFFPSLT